MALFFFFFWEPNVFFTTICLLSFSKSGNFLSKKFSQRHWFFNGVFSTLNCIWLTRHSYYSLILGSWPAKPVFSKLTLIELPKSQIIQIFLNRFHFKQYILQNRTQRLISLLCCNYTSNQKKFFVWFYFFNCFCFDFFMKQFRTRDLMMGTKQSRIYSHVYNHNCNKIDIISILPLKISWHCKTSINLKRLLHEFTGKLV